LRPPVTVTQRPDAWSRPWWTEAACGSRQDPAAPRLSTANRRWSRRAPSRPIGGRRAVRPSSPPKRSRSPSTRRFRRRRHCRRSHRSQRLRRFSRPRWRRLTFRTSPAFRRQRLPRFPRRPPSPRFPRRLLFPRFQRFSRSRPSPRLRLRSASPPAADPPVCTARASESTRARRVVHPSMRATPRPRRRAGLRRPRLRLP